jgi:predicted DsbA family dithiol-disulfide isomerase
MGIDAIPAHIVRGRYLLVGAQPSQVFIDVQHKLRADEDADQSHPT